MGRGRRATSSPASELARRRSSSVSSPANPTRSRSSASSARFVRTYQGRGDAQLIELSRQAAEHVPADGGVAGVDGAVRSALRQPGGRARSSCGGRRRAVSSGSVGTRCGSSRSRSTPTRRRVCTLRDAAALVHELMAPWDDQSSGAARSATATCACGSVSRPRRWGGTTRPTRQFAFACRFHDDNGLRLWSARSHLGWAEALAARGERAQAQEHAARALELARAHGYGLIEALAAPIAASSAVASD